MGMLSKKDKSGKVVRPTHGGGESRTKQSFKDDCDINIVVERHARTGFLNTIQAPPPMYLDLASVQDWKTAMDHMTSMNTYFMELPAAVRAEFDNDPAKFTDFLAAHDAHEQLKDLGLAAIDEIATDQDDADAQDLPAPPDPPAADPPPAGP